MSSMGWAVRSTLDLTWGELPAPVLGLMAAAESWIKPDDIESYCTSI